MAEPNPKYSFENFYVYEGARLAYAACDAVLKNKGMFNPLYIYGEEGSGKTHILSACANYLIQKNENVLFLTPFEFQEIVSSRKIPRNSWIIVDDFHDFVKIDEEVQKAFLINFETFLAQDNQFILSSLYEIENFKELILLLKSRLLSGIEVGILPPDLNEVYEIIKFKLSKKGVEIDESLIKIIRISEKINLRKIEGIVNKLILLNIVKKGNIDYRDITYTFQKGQYEEVIFPDLKEKIEESISQIVEEIEDAKKIKDFLEEKIYIWSMKGFEVRRLEALRNAPLETIKKEYDRFVEDIKKLVELQKRYGEIGETDEEIERMLFDPDKIEEIEKRMNELVKKKEEEIVEVEEVPEIIVGEFNKDAFDFLKGLDKEPPGMFTIISKGRNGVTSLLNYGFKILKEKGKIFLNELISNFEFVSKDIEEFPDLSDYKYLFIDDLHSFLKIEEIRKNLKKLLKKWIGEGKKVIAGSHEEIDIEIPVKKIYISSPTPDAIEKIIILYSSLKGKIIEKDAMQKIIQRKWEDLKELTNFLNEIFSLPKERITSEDFEIEVPREEKSLIDEIAFDFIYFEEILWEEI